MTLEDSVGIVFTLISSQASLQSSCEGCGKTRQKEFDLDASIFFWILHPFDILQVIVIVLLIDVFLE